MRLAALLTVFTLSSCCTTLACGDSVSWMLGTPLETGTYVITACVDDDCDEATVSITEDGSSSTMSTRITALPTRVSFSTAKTNGIRGRLEIKRDAALVLSDLRSLSWMTSSNPAACAANCVMAVIALE